MESTRYVLSILAGGTIMKRVRILLRVSSNQQLEKDGDLTVQRELVLAYVKKHPDWILDTKEYFEGSNSGFKNSVDDRDVLQEALDDAERGAYDILVVYKDDRIGRRMWEIGAYINQLKQFGVDIYTTIDDCITPEVDDMMGQMMLAFRYNIAEKSSRDTGIRVRDSAKELVKKGKFMGGKAPYGYELRYSGEISKHGRALKKLAIMPEKVEVVQYIYSLYLYKGFGATKIAKVLNEDDKYHQLAPKNNWKSGTINSILTNPVYAGYVAYNRRERKKDGAYHKLGQDDWIISNESNPEIVMIHPEEWDKAQDERARRVKYYQMKECNRNATAIKTSHIELILLDVIHCGYCGGKLTNATKYSYWTIKDTGERKKNKIPAYKCIRAWQGEPHNKRYIFKGEEIDKIVLDEIEKYIARIQEGENAYNIFLENQMEEKQRVESRYKKSKDELKRMKDSLQIMLDKIPEAIQGNYALSVEELNMALTRQKEKIQEQKKIVENEEHELETTSASLDDWEDIKSKIPTWIEVLRNSDYNAKRTLVNRLIERVEVTDEQVLIRFRITLEDMRL